MQNSIDSKTYKNILALDTAMGCASVSIYKNGKYTERIRHEPRGHAEHLIPMVDEAMNQAKIAYSDLDAIITTVGPGSFTGLRVGLSAAKSYGLACNVPVIGMSTLDLIGKKACDTLKPDFPILAVIETRREEFYVQAFTWKKEEQVCEKKSDAACLSAGDIVAQYTQQKYGLAGDAITRLHNSFTDKDKNRYNIIEGYEFSDMYYAIRLFLENPDIENFLLPDPLYLRPPDVSQSKKKKIVLES